MLKRLDKNLLRLIDKNRLLTISPFSKNITRPASQVNRRNKPIAEVSDKTIFTYSTAGCIIKGINNINLSKIDFD